MTAPEHTVEACPTGGFFVRVRGEIAGSISEDAEYAGLWSAWDQRDKFVCHTASQREAAAFLAARFVAEEESQP